VIFGLAGGLYAVQRQMTLDGGDEGLGGFLHQGLAMVGFAEPKAEIAMMRAGYTATADPTGKPAPMFNDIDEGAALGGGIQGLGYARLRHFKGERDGPAAEPLADGWGHCCRYGGSVAGAGRAQAEASGFHFNLILQEFGPWSRLHRCMSC